MRAGCWFALLLTGVGAAGCRIYSGIDEGRSGRPSSEAGAPAGDGAGGDAVASGGGDGSGGAAGGGGSAEGLTATADCPTPANHCLEPDELFVADRPYKSGLIRVKLAKQTGAPNSSGEATFVESRDAETITSKFFWRSRPANAAELKPGQIVIAFEKSKEGIYQAPKNRDEARHRDWFMARIVSVATVAHGYVLTAGGYRIGLSAVRLAEAEVPVGQVTGQEDKQFLNPDHYFVSDRALPDSGRSRAAPAVPIQHPSPQTNHEGHFIRTTDGEVLWTPHAWRTRLATRDDLKVGTHVFVHEKVVSGVYRGPETREQALMDSWFVGKIVDTSQLYKGVVEVAGGFKVAADEVRVVAK